MKYKKKIIQNQLVDSNGIEVIFTVIFSQQQQKKNKIKWTKFKRKESSSGS